MSEPNFNEVQSARTFTPTTFTGGDLDFPFYASNTDSWYPSKSYLRVGLNLLGTGGVQPTTSQLLALADNACGNLFSNVSLWAGQDEISSCRVGVAQASALNARTKSHAWLKSIDRGAGLNEPKFSKRVMNIASDSPADAYLTAINEMYKPVTPGSFLTARVDISRTFGVEVTVDKGGVQNSVAVLQSPLQQGGVVTGTLGADFLTGMPLGSAPTGGPIVIGDVLVWNDAPYNIVAVTDATHLLVSASPVIIIGTNVSTDWYIIRKDMIRAPQAASNIFAIWQPPIGIFDYKGPLGGGNFKLSLSPNINYSLAAVESKNAGTVLGTDFTLQVTSLKFYTYVEKMKIPDQIQELPLLEYQVLSKPWQPTVNFDVSPETEAITIFIQDRFAGTNILVPPSMFKTIDNTDLKLQKIQVTYANINKPSTQWDSSFGGSSNQMQQRYHDSYRELGLDIDALGCEPYEDYLQRGPFYHYNFIRDVNNRATSVSVSTTFAGLPNGPFSNYPNDGSALVYCISHYRATATLTTSNGRIVSAQALRG